MTKFTPIGVVERMIPGFPALRDEIAKIAQSGFSLAINVRFMTPELAYSTFPDEWIEQYLRHNYAIMDPVLLWTAYNDGIARWSDIGLPSKLPLAIRVMSRAATYGLRYGAITCFRNHQAGGRKCFMSVARDDRELTDEELSDVQYLFGEIVSGLYIASGLSPSEIEVLSHLANGLTQDEIAIHLKINRDAVKKRIERARERLQAKNTSHAVAIAIQRNIVRVDRV